MNHKALSIRPFIGANDFETSRNFYHDLGFVETTLFPEMSVFKNGNIAFYLQDANIKDWVDNTQVFVEVESVEEQYKQIASLDLPARYEGVRLTHVHTFEWGKECYLHDPSGILWHFGEFANNP